MTQITYKLAKQLRENGFQQVGLGITMDYYLDDNGNKIELKENIYFPTFSEITDACGDKFIGLINDGYLFYAIEKWGSIKKNKAGGITFKECSLWTGYTPEEAVTYLWLALNKKEDE